MAPEQIRGDRIDGRTDLYSLGVTLFELLTGELPFQGGTPEYLLAQHLTRDAPRLEDLDPELPELPHLQELLDLCLAKDPAERARDAKSLGLRIDALITRLGGPALIEARESMAAAAPGAAEQAPVEARRRSRSALPFVLALTLALAALLALFLAYFK